MILVLTTTDKKDVAQKISEALIKQRLSACCSILPGVESTYWWKGKIAKETEFQILIKSKEEKFAEIERLVKELHNYDLPEIICINLDKVGKDYLKWLESELS